MTDDMTDKQAKTMSYTGRPTHDMSYLGI